MHMQSASVTSIYFCLPDENTKEATKPARPRTRGMLTMKPQQNKRLHTKHEPTNETTNRVKGRKNAEQHLQPDRQRQHRFHGCRPQPVRLRQSLLHLVQEGFQQVRFLKVFIKRLGCCDEPVQQPRRSHIPWTVRRQIETNRIYAPTNSSICGMLFLPNSTCCVPSARVMTMQGTLIAP